MDMLSLLALGKNIGVRANGSVGNLWQFGRNVKSKSTEFLDVDTLTGTEVVVQVLDHGSPDDKHLTEGIREYDLMSGQTQNKTSHE